MGYFSTGTGWALLLFTKTTGLLIIPTWLAAMGWLVAYDVWPRFNALEAPPLHVTDWLAGEGRRTRYTIHDEFGRMGTIWSEYFIDDLSVQRRDLIWIERLPVGETPMRMKIQSKFTAEGVLDEITFHLNTAGPPLMRLHGERFRTHFSFTLDMGGKSRRLKIPLTDGDVISGAFSPFPLLADLRVGQRWRVQVFNPVAVLTGLGDRFISMLMEVTGEERITVGDRQVNCMVVECSGTKAWVDARGAVQVQEATLPLLGTLRLVRESFFDEEARHFVNSQPVSELGRRAID